MKLLDYVDKWRRLSTKKTLRGDETLTAVQQDAYALQYLADGQQTEAVCLAAVQQHGDALRYVAEWWSWNPAPATSRE